jgi:hypothetical protein
MEPVFVLFVLPVLIGILSERIFRDTRHASLAAAIASVLLVWLCVHSRAPDETWGWLASLLVSPLPIAFALVAVLYCYGRQEARDRRRHEGA